MFFSRALLFPILWTLLTCSADKIESRGPIMHDFDKLWDYNDPAATGIKFREILNTISFAETPEKHLELRTQIARTLSLQQKFDEAHELLDGVESELKPDYPIATIRYLLERGRTFNSSGMKEKSRELFLEAWELGLNVKADFYAVDAAHMLGIVEAPDQQLEWNEKAMNLAENSPDERANGWLGSLYNNIGWTHHDMGNYDKALEVFEKGLVFRQEKKQVNETQIAKWCVARTHRSLGNVDVALDMQLTLEKEILESGNPEDGYVSEEIAECLTLKGEVSAAAPHFLKAWTLLSQDIWLQKNETERLERLKTLGEQP